MKYEFKLVNGYGVLVDKEAEININDYYTYGNKIEKVYSSTLSGKGLSKVIFAQAELNLDVPILPNWKDWELEQLANRYVNKRYKESDNPSYMNTHACEIDFIAGYKASKAEFTREDIIKAMQFGLESDFLGYTEKETNEFIESLKPLPKFIEVDSHLVWEYDGDNCHNSVIEFKTITNSQGKEECIIKQVIY